MKIISEPEIDNLSEKLQNAGIAKFPAFSAYLQFQRIENYLRFVTAEIFKLMENHFFSKMDSSLLG